MKKQLEQRGLSLLLSGKHPQAKKYAGHHVLVIGNKVFPLREGKEAINDIQKLKKKFGTNPVITFVPRRDISYILFLCKK